MPKASPHIDEAAEAEKLRQCRAIIEDTLREFDVCGALFLAGRAGRFEQVLHLRASWSNLHLAEVPGGAVVRLKSKLADYNGDADLQRLHQEWSVGVVSGLGTAVAQGGLYLLQAAEHFDKLTGATHTAFRRDDPRDTP